MVNPVDISERNSPQECNQHLATTSFLDDKMGNGVTAFRIYKLYNFASSLYFPLFTTLQ